MRIVNINKTDIIKINDTATQIRLRILDFDNKPFDLTTAMKVIVVIGISKGRLLTKVPELLGETGVIEFGLDEGDLLVVGDNLLEVHIIMPNGEKHVAPSNGHYRLRLQRSIDCLGEKITTVTLDYFIEKVDEKIAELQDKIDYVEETREYFETHLDETVDLAVDNKMTPFIKLRFQQGVATITGANSNGYFRSSDPFVTVSIDGFPQINAPNYDVLVTPISGDAGLVGRLEVYDKTQNGFKVKMTGSASSVTFLWTILNPNV